MRILAFTDTHNTKKAIVHLLKQAKKHKVDAVLCCGDMTIFGLKLKKALKDLNSFKLPVYFIHGNHEDIEPIEKLLGEFSNLHFIHKKHALLWNVLILGYGGEGFSTIDKKFKKVGDRFSALMKKSKAEHIVFMTHAPPYKTHLDDIDGEHCGNKTFKQFVLKHKNRLRVYLCGHFHENFNKQEKIGKCFLLNPGPGGTVLELK